MMNQIDQSSCPGSSDGVLTFRSVEQNQNTVSNKLVDYTEKAKWSRNLIGCLQTTASQR
jgi:hypothetical protein